MTTIHLKHARGVGRTGGDPAVGPVHVVEVAKTAMLSW